MLQTIRKLLQGIIDNIDAGNTDYEEDELIDIAVALKEALRKDTPLSKYQAYTYLGISRATFDNLVRDGKIPPGKKVEGFKEKFWYKKDLKNITNKKPR